MTTSPNKMSDEEIYQSITDICFENGGVTKPMADKLMLLIKQHREAYAIEERLDELEKTVLAPLNGKTWLDIRPDIELARISRRIAELREKVGK